MISKSQPQAQQQQHTDRPILIIDALNTFVRHFMVNQEVSTRSEPIGGVVGFMKSIDYLVGTFYPSKVFVVWENGGPSSRRKHISPNYKANRAKIKEIRRIQKGTAGVRDVLVLDQETRVNQITALTKILKTTPVCQVFVADTEGDDIVAYLAKEKFKNQTCKKVIVSNDKDFYQLLDDPTIQIYDPATRDIIDDNKVIKKFGIAARNFCMAKTIAGDDSDNVEGVQGVGFKTISKRFPAFANQEEDVSVQSLMEDAREAYSASKKAPKVYADVISSEDLIRRNWDLMYLDSSNLSASQIAKINYIVDTHEPKMDKLGLIKVIMEVGINTAFDYDKFSSQMRNFVR